jgi:hypothetical protein
MKVYHFPAASINRLVRESIYGHYVQLLKYPDPSAPPFTALDAATMPWPELQGLILSHLRHRYTSYEADLAAGADRDLLHRNITADALYAYPWLRKDPRPFPADPPRRLLDEAAAHLATLTDLKHGLLEALPSPGGRTTSRETIKEMLARIEGEIAELTTLLTQQRIREDGVIGSYRRVLVAGEPDWLGHALKPNHLDTAGFRCPGCSATIYRTKRPVLIGQGKKAVVLFCHCLVYFLPEVNGMKVEPMTVSRWQGYVDWLVEEDPLPNPASTTASP